MECIVVTRLTPFSFLSSFKFLPDTYILTHILTTFSSSVSISFLYIMLSSSSSVSNKFLHLLHHISLLYCISITSACLNPCILWSPVFPTFCVILSLLYGVLFAFQAPFSSRYGTNNARVALKTSLTRLFLYFYFLLYTRKGQETTP